MIKNYLNKYKLDQLKQIEKDYKYIYIFRYNNLKANEIILLKKNFKFYKFLILKQNLIKKNFINLKGQGSLILFYSNENIIENLLKLKKLELIYILNNYQIFSNLKIKEIFKKKNLPLNIQLKKSFLFFLYSLRNIQK
jgi:ribosomal protein L10